MKLPNALMHPREAENILATQLDQITGQDHRFEKISDNRINLKLMRDKEVETSQDLVNTTSVISTTKETEHPQAWATKTNKIDHHIPEDLKAATDPSQKKVREQAILR